MSELNGFSRHRVAILGVSIPKDQPVTLILNCGIEVEMIVLEIGPDSVIRGQKAMGVTGGEHFKVSRAGMAAIKLDTVIGVIQPVDRIPTQRSREDWNT